jgi:hypothetical protein
MTLGHGRISKEPAGKRSAMHLVEASRCPRQQHTNVLKTGSVVGLQLIGLFQLPPGTKLLLDVEVPCRQAPVRLNLFV